MMLSLLRHEVMYYFKNRKELIEFISFIFLFMLLFSFSWPSSTHHGAEDGIAALWIALLAGSALGTTGMFTRDLESGVLELYQLAPAGFERVVLTKWLGLYFALLVPLTLSVPVMGLWFAVPSAHWPLLLVGLAVGAGAASTLQTLVAGLLAGTGRGAAFLVLLSLPLLVPVIIFGTAYCRQPDLWNAGIWFLGGYWLFLLPLTCWAVAASLRASN